MSPSSAGAEICGNCKSVIAADEWFCTSCGKPAKHPGSEARRPIAGPATLRTTPQAPQTPAPPQTAAVQPGAFQPVPAAFAATQDPSAPMTWEMLFLFNIISLGVVGIVQAFRQVQWLRKLHPQTLAFVRLLVAAVSGGAAFFLYVIYLANLPAASNSVSGGMVEQAPQTSSLLLLLLLVSSLGYIIFLVFWVLYTLAFRESLIAFATVNNLPLKPNLALSLLFSYLYFQVFVRKIELQLRAAQAASAGAI